MLSYEQALKKILEHTFPLKPRLLPLRESLGLVLAENLFSPEPFPVFDNSAVDGYAVVSGPVKKKEKSQLKVVGEIRAGEFFKESLKPGEALRIFTGAPVPKGADAVVMQEHVARVNGTLSLLNRPKPKENIRFRGEDFSKGKLLIRKGTLLEPAHLALLRAVGREEAPVYPLPTVSILATGSELLREGEPVTLGKIRDSNSILLEALVKKTGGIPQRLPSVGDEPGEIRSAIRKGLKENLLLISGGVSVGKYDFVKGILRKEGVREIFWKVNIKPGKPLFFGKKRGTLVFGLPGNPVSVFVTFEEFVKPALLKMRKRPLMRKEIKGYLTDSFRNGPRLHFVRVRSVPKKKRYAITPLKGQGSHMIGTLAQANSLLRVEPNVLLKRNQKVSVELLREK